MAGPALTVRRIAGALAGRVPVVRPGGGERAAVALLLHDSAEEEAPRLLLIERARREGDPWSGDLAFPGGRMEPGDAGERAAAERETAEEIAVDLAAARCLGRLDDMEASLLPMTVAAFVYSVESATVPALSLSEEVTEAFWVPLPDLFDRRRRREHRLRRGTAEHRFPALDLLGPGRPLLWGLSYRFIRSLGDLVDESRPETGAPEPPR